VTEDEDAECSCSRAQRETRSRQLHVQTERSDENNHEQIQKLGKENKFNLKEAEARKK
jgi:uncharacterized lipoprotein